ncbi:hypothetical protein ACS25B_08715 [Dickeya dadantii subsp. dieffenbachiae]|uniref:hypothetical protein n=1 Tax=Dickeya dadantii TaxID=204038 RepID=UPI0005776105|nr:hypothetical protein [Dickeya dadantii]
MNNIPTIGSYTVTDPQSGQSWRVTHSTAEQQADVDNSGAVADEVKIERQDVNISAEALSKYQAYIEARKSGDATANQVTVSEGVALQVPAALSEEVLANLMNSADTLWVERMKRVDQETLNLRSVSSQIESTYMSFLEQLGKDNPDLKGATFGFSVSKYNRLVVTGAQGLNQEQIQRLERALNSSRELVDQANKLADTQIALFEAESPHAVIAFNRDNYAQTIDIGAELLTRNRARYAARDGSANDVHQKNWDNNWRQQLARKGVRISNEGGEA